MFDEKLISLFPDDCRNKLCFLKLRLLKSRRLTLKIYVDALKIETWTFDFVMDMNLVTCSDAAQVCYTVSRVHSSSIVMTSESVANNFNNVWQLSDWPDVY